MMQIQIKYLSDIETIAPIKNGDWIDLRASKDVEMKQWELKLISLGVAMKLPDGYEARVLPRSSTAKNFGIIMANSMGVIDNSYSGDEDEWKFSAFAIRDTKINKGDRICQFRVVEKQPELEFISVETLGNKSRGGFGSTGKK